MQLKPVDITKYLGDEVRNNMRWKEQFTLVAPMAALLVLWTALMTPVTAHREHKVHNIVLYPDKYSWCNVTPIKQVVAYPDCTSVEIDNNVCVGTCFSYSIPLTLPSAPGEIIEPYCDSCRPSSVVWQNFTLTCQEKTMEKTVQIIQNCTCHSCHKGGEQAEAAAPAESGRALRWMESSPAADVDADLDSDQDDNEAVVNFLQSDPAYTTEEKLQYLCRHVRGKEATKADDIKHSILNLEKKEILKVNHPATRHHHHGHHHQPQQQEEDTTERAPTLDLAPAQMSPANGGDEITYIPDHGQPA